MKDKIKLMIHGDAVVPTGFSRVLHSIVENLPKEVYDISWLGINYYGDPHTFPYRIYPASTRGDIWGMNRIKEVLQREKPDILLILNDIWVIYKILEELKGFQGLPKIVTYFPVDGMDYTKEWFKEFGVVDKTVVYTQFAKNVVEACGARNINISIVPHGMSTDLFYPIRRPKQEIKALVYPNIDEFTDSFIILNANRNQPRKRIDIFLEAFKLFSENKPINIKAYCFTAETPVLTKSSIKDIKDISVGDKVLTHNRTWKSVTNLSKRFINEPIYKIEYIGGEPLQLTGEHPLLAIRTVKCSYCPNKNIICKSSCQQQYKRLKSGKITNNCSAKYYKNYIEEWIKAKELRVGDMLVMKSPTEHLEQYTDDDQQLARLCGWYVAEGSTNKSAVMFTTASDELPAQKEIEETMLSHFGISEKRYHEYKARGVLQQHFCNISARNWFNENCGKGAYNKRIPEFVLNGSKEVITEFLNTYYYGDGFFSKKEKYFSLCTVSRTLAYQIKLILLRLGIYGILRKNYSSGEFNTWTVEVWGRQALILAELFNFKPNKINVDCSQRTDVINGVVYIPITKIEKIDYSGEVFNLEIEDDNSYTVGDVIAHNCHMGLRDAGWDISDLAVRYGIDTRLIITNQSATLQTVSDEKLNVIYNATDAGVNCSIGEGWGLVSTEHMVTGAPQIVSDHSACHELFEDCGILVPAPIKLVDTGINITHYASRPEDLAIAMETLYTNKELFSELSKKGYDKFTDEKYSWKAITKIWDGIFQGVVS